MGMIMEFANRIFCPNCKNPNYMVSLADISDDFQYKCTNCNSYFTFYDLASRTPTIKKDLVEVVRCKDCEDACICSDDWVICTHIDSNGNDKHPVDWYCADGERRTEDA